jgi:AcrR family transcriptional regulator
VRAGRRRQPLTRDAIVDAAVRIVDREGVEALTVRRLGEELDTGSATIYWYVSGKDELAELVYDRVMSEVELPPLDPVHWQAAVKELAWRIYRVLLGHRDVARLSLGRVPVGPSMLRIVEWGLELTSQAGLAAPVGAYFGDILGRYIDASVLEVGASGGPPLEMVAQYWRSLPAEQFPRIAALTSEMFSAEDDTEARFEFGLDLLIRGLEAYAPPPPPPPKKRRTT